MNPEQIELYEPEANTWWVGELTTQADLGAGAVFGHFVDAKQTLRLAVVHYPEAALVFTVTDWQGNPVPNVTVTVVHDDGTPYKDSVGNPARSVTDKNGRYKIKANVKRTFRLEVVPPQQNQNQKE